MEISSMMTIAWNKSLPINIWVLTSLISLTGTTTLRKGLLEARKLIMRLKIIVRMLIFVFGVKKGSSLRPSSP